MRAFSKHNHFEFEECLKSIAIDYPKINLKDVKDSKGLRDAVKEIGLKVTISKKLMSDGKETKKGYSIRIGN